MVEYLAVRDGAHTPNRVHAFISAFHRVADESQREELERHNMAVFSLRTGANAMACCDWIRAQIAAGKHVILHIDECDFGAGERQILGQVYRFARTREEVTSILYSATPQEVLYSGEVEEEEYEGMINEFIHRGERIEYTPPATFCGPSRFLDQGLITDANPFFTKDGTILRLSEQGREIVANIRANVEANNRRNIGVLRLSYSDLGAGRAANKKEQKAIYQFLLNWKSIPELEGFLIIADKDDSGDSIPSSADVLTEKIKWSDRDKYWRGKASDIPILVVIDQTSSRSTEWTCHDRVSAYHDYRNSPVFSTLSQAQERVNHYEGRYEGGFQRIKVYGSLKTFLLSANRMDYETYLHVAWEAKKVVRQDAYTIRSADSPHTQHPSYPDPVSKKDADQILQNLGCFKSKLSPRVRGKVKVCPVYTAEFHPCTTGTFADLKSRLDLRFPDHPFTNPFLRSEREGRASDGRYKGYLRGWKVFDFATEILTQPGWGLTAGPRLTICYRGAELGVALRFDTGETEEKSTLSTHGSMFKH